MVVAVAWLTCVCEFRGRRREVMPTTHSWTELFFLDEATALGRRPSPLLLLPP